MITVKEVITKKDWKAFATFPIKLYKDNPYYVPSFIADEMTISDEKKNPPAKGCKVKAFLAYKGDRLVGRIAGIIVNESNRVYNENAIRFSRFDFVEDIEVAKALLDAVKQFGKENGMNRLHGPWGFNDTDREGMLTYGFDKHGSYATYYNYPYYPEFMDKLGYKEESVWIEQKITFPKQGDALFNKYLKLSDFIKRKYKIREVSGTLPMKEIVKRYGDKFFDCYNAAYKDLDLFVDITGDAKKAVLEQFTLIINPRYFSILVDENDQVVAFMVLLPAIGKTIKKHNGKLNLFSIIDLLKTIKKPDAVELTLAAVRPEYKSLGFTAACIGRIVKNVVEDGITDVVSDPTLESNTAVRAQWSQAESEVIKRRQTYTIDI